LYCFGDPQETLGSPYGQPFIQIFYNAMQSKVGTTVLTSLLITLYVFATFGFVASASRQTWAFSRDNGLPLSRWLKRVRTGSIFVNQHREGCLMTSVQVEPTRSIPLAAILMTGTINALFGLINVRRTQPSSPPPKNPS
jgi:choline transport protein